MLFRLIMYAPATLVFAFVFYNVFKRYGKLLTMGHVLISSGVTMAVNFLCLSIKVAVGPGELLTADYILDLVALILIIFFFTILPGLILLKNGTNNNGSGSDI